MGTVAKIARRSFLIGSVAIAGGVAFGVYRVKTPYANPLTEGLAEGSATFNPWVLIDRDKITLFTPHADKGQGVVSAQAALIAEELDLEWGQFETSFGAPDKAYWNTAMADESVPFAATDASLGARSARVVAGGVIKLFQFQGTGGSTTMSDSFDKLRHAGAVARETLKRAAAEQFSVPVSSLTTAKGAVVLPDGTAVPYTELAAVAATIEPVSEVVLRDPSTWRLIGKPMARLDILAKSTGTLDYGIDFTMDGMLYAAVKTNPRQGGVMNGYNADAALQMRGVHSIAPVTNGVAVLADNSWRAFQAADAIEFDWGPAPYPAEMDDHWAAIAESFTDERLDAEWRNDGNTETVFAQTPPYVAEYHAPYVAHAPLEPLNATILVTAEGVDIWTGHQMPGFLVTIVAGVTGHDASDIRFHNLFMGGSFGHRLEYEHIKQAAEIGMLMLGKPIKLTYSREEDFAHEFPRHPGIARAKGVVKDGKVNAVDLQVAMPSVMRSQMGRAGVPTPGPDAQIAAGSWGNPYGIPNSRMRAYRVPELAPTSSWRSVGASANGFFFDSFLDELIHQAGADPMLERIRLMNDDVSRKVLEAVAEMSSWGGALGENQGRGVAFVESFGVPTAEVIEVTNTQNGIRIDKVWLAAEVGTVIDPQNFENLGQGGVVFGLGHAINCEITYSDGMAEQSNYHAHEAMRMYQCPEIFVKGLENGDKVRGFGEPPVPPAAPALANAIFDATGTRIREMPFNKHINFV